MRRKSYYVILILFLLAAVLAVTALAAGLPGRWFRTDAKNSLARAGRVEGDVSVLRSGMAYVLKDDVLLRQDDALITGPDSGCQALFTDGTLVTLDGYSEVSLQGVKDRSFSVIVREGAAMIETAGESALPMTVGSDDVRLEVAPGELLMVEAYHGTVTASIFRGAPLLRCGEREYPLVPGDRVVFLRGDDDTELFFNRVLSSDLREFALRSLIEKGGVIFEAEQLEAVLEKRRAETAQVALPYDGEGLHCTLEIRCDTVLGHLDMLPPEEAAAIPADGVILPATQVTFSRGDSVYDVLRRTCLSNGIEIDYNYAVYYTGYYVDHLAGLAEFDCGPQSGWMYKVNGWFPNYGSAKYYVNDGDVILWLYSCEGLGADIGAETWKSDTEAGRRADG